MDLNIILSDNNFEKALGVFDGIYYMRETKDGCWNEIPVSTYNQAFDYFINEMKKK